MFTFRDKSRVLQVFNAKELRKEKFCLVENMSEAREGSVIFTESNRIL